MTRIDEVQTKTATVVSRADFETDLKRGYAIIEYAPAGEMVVKNPRNPAKEIRRPVAAIIMFRCMRCKFDSIDGPYTGERTGTDLIKEHLFRGDHPWPYHPFENPYGNTEDVTIEGIEEYQKEIEAL